MRIEKKLKSNKGFTLVELVVVIAVLAILAGVGTVAYSGYIKRANQAKDITNLDAVKTACVAACVQDGAVNKIEVTVDASAKTISTVKVYLDKDTTTGFLLYGTSKDEENHKAACDNFTQFLTDVGSMTFTAGGSYSWSDDDGGWKLPTTTGE